MEDIIKASNSINSSSGSIPSFKPPKTPKKPPAPPSAPAKDPMIELMKMKKERWRHQINHYLESKVFKPRLQDSGFETIDLAKSHKLTAEQMKEILDGIQIHLMRDEKRQWVDGIFKTGLKALSVGTAIMTQCPEYNMIPAMVEEEATEAHKKGEFSDFEVELEEISILLDPSWVPGPEKRLMAKIARLILGVHEIIEKKKQQTDQDSKNKNDNK